MKPGPKPQIVEARFDKQWIPEPNSGCWLWIGALDAYGYGAFAIKIDGKWGMRKAHRIAYERFVGPIPDNLEPDHLCRTKCCINPSHLDPVSGRVNTLRSDGVTAKNSRKTHCNEGHAFDGSNLGFKIDQRGRKHRYCKQCNHDDGMRRRARLSCEAI